MGGSSREKSKYFQVREMPGLLGFSIFEITWLGRTLNVLGGETGGKARLCESLPMIALTDKVNR